MGLKNFACFNNLLSLLGQLKFPFFKLVVIKWDLEARERRSMRPTTGKKISSVSDILRNANDKLLFKVRTYPVVERVFLLWILKTMNELFPWHFQHKIIFLIVAEQKFLAYRSSILFFEIEHFAERWQLNIHEALLKWNLKAR